MSQINVCYCGGGEIRRDEMYTLGVFLAKTGLVPSAFNKAYMAGLRVLVLHGMTFVRGGDWIDYLIAPKRDPIPDGGPTDSDMRGEVKHD